jgi:hypothetical protein
MAVVTEGHVFYMTAVVVNYLSTTIVMSVVLLRLAYMAVQWANYGCTTPHSTDEEGEPLLDPSNEHDEVEEGIN